ARLPAMGAAEMGEAALRVFLHERTVRLAKDAQHRPADELAHAVAQLLRAEAVHRNNGAFLIDDEVHRRVRLEGDAPEFFELTIRLLGALALADIVVCLQYRDRCAMLVTLQRPAARHDHRRAVLARVPQLALP